MNQRADQPTHQQAAAKHERDVTLEIAMQEKTGAVAGKAPPQAYPTKASRWARKEQQFAIPKNQ
jgi:hypothetical protein